MTTKQKQDRADCLTCGTSFDWSPGAEELSFPVPDGDWDEALRTDSPAPVGHCPRCGDDAVVYTLPGGQRIRFHGGYAVLTISEQP